MWFRVRLAGECGSECVCVCVCFSKEKRNKRESRPKERREVGENVWWGVGLGGGTRGPQKKKS